MVVCVSRLSPHRPVSVSFSPILFLCVRIHVCFYVWRAEVNTTCLSQLPPWDLYAYFFTLVL